MGTWAICSSKFVSVLLHSDETNMAILHAPTGVSMGINLMLLVEHLSGVFSSSFQSGFGLLSKLLLRGFEVVVEICGLLLFSKQH